MDVLDGELHGGALGRLHHPEEEVGLLAGLQVYAVVARPLIAQLIDIVLGNLPLDLVLLLAVRHHIPYVVHQVAKARIYSTGTEH